MNKEKLKKLVLDTSVLIQCQGEIENIFGQYELLIPSIVADELDNMKESSDSRRRYNGRSALRFIEKNESVFTYIVSEKREVNDDAIIEVAILNNAMISTKDRGMKIRCLSKGIGVLDFSSKKVRENYTGYKVWELDVEDESDAFILASLYSNKIEVEDDEFLENEYLIIKDSNTMKLIDAFKFHNGGFEKVIDRIIDSEFFGKVKPKDIIQNIAIDNLFSNQVKMIKGRAGSGKTLLSLSYCMKMLDKGERDKIVFFVNPAGARNSVELGFYPGTRLEKILDTSVGTMLGAKFVDKGELMRQINNQKIEILPFVDIRGYDTTGKNCIVYILEAQNLDIELLRLGLQRIGDDCEVIIDGDADTQVDKTAYENGNNGMKRMSEIFRGSDIYGEVELKNIYRSKIADLADLM